uniref:Uncharacterized protein n=1 Tax=Rhizophora mucronata TaxID=61149 RepID=A0A2P2NI60_RHIMU
MHVHAQVYEKDKAFGCHVCGYKLIWTSYRFDEPKMCYIPEK